ncbi:hypothetical protein Tco_1306097, partial [Tanacetum coccineum]
MLTATVGGKEYDIMYILGKSWRATRPVASTTTTCFASEGEALLPRGIIGNARGICHVAQPGGAVNVRPL